MALTTPYDVYQRTQVDTASPAKLVVMLYDGAIRFLKQGQAAMERGDREAQNHTCYEPNGLSRSWRVR